MLQPFGGLKNYVMIALLGAGMMLCSCGTPTETVQQLECPPPPSHPCQPGTFNKVLFDTTASVGPDVRDFNYSIIHLDTAINTPVDQWGMAFLHKGHSISAFLTDMRDSGGIRQVVTSFKNRAPENFTEQHPLSVAIDFDTVNIGSFAIDAKNMVVYFAAPRPNSIRGDYDIYSGHLKHEGDSFAIVEAAPLSDNVNKDSAWDAQPALSPDGNTLYFASDRAGGKGGTDIWCSKKHGGEWGKAFDLDTNVNTECDELTPYVSPDGSVLYFSSSGHATVGGYDIFISDITSSGLSPAENIGEPVNTPSDELFPSTYADSLLYYASNQPGGYGGFDMYLLKKIPAPKNRHVALAPPEKKLEAEIIPDAVQPKTLKPLPPIRPDSSLIKGVVVNARTRDPIDSAEVTVHLPPPDSLTQSMITDTGGKFEVKLPSGKNYQLIAQAPNYFYGVFDEQPAVDSIVHVTLALPETLALRLQFPLDDSKHPYQKTLSDSGTPGTLTWDQEIDLLAANLRTYKDRIKEITLVGNTDSSGSDKYNDRLGLRRAEFVKEQLIERGVPGTMLFVRSDGRRNPLPRKPEEPQETYRARCRRTEIAKISRRE